MANKRPKRFGVTWTKNITRILLIVGVVEATAPYILSAFGKEPCETMGAAWVTEIVAVALGYFVRGFKDTKESEQVRLYENYQKGINGDEDDEEVQG